jgi:hypothetical protein
MILSSIRRMMSAGLVKWQTNSIDEVLPDVWPGHQPTAMPYLLFKFNPKI